PQAPPRARRLGPERAHRVLEGLHARRLSCRPLRAEHRAAALPVSPIGVRRARRRPARVRARRTRAAPVADRDRRRGLHHRPERLPRTDRPELLEPSVSARHRCRLGALAVAVGIATAGCGAHSIVNPKGSEADRIAGVWWLMFGLAAAVYVVVAGC